MVEPFSSPSSPTSDIVLLSLSQLQPVSRSLICFILALFLFYLSSVGGRMLGVVWSSRDLEG